MAARLSANGKPLGRPPKDASAKAAEDAKAVAQLARTIKARYDAAGHGRRLAGWNPPGSGPNRAMTGVQTVRNRARDTTRNDWAGESTVQKWATTLVGIAITPRFNKITAAARKLAITELWQDFVAAGDADCVLDVYGLQTLIVRTWFDGGECFVRRRPRFPDAGYPVPLQVQALEPEMVPMLDADTYTGLPAANIIRSGIEFDKRGTRVAYWFFKQHPGDPTPGIIPTYGADDLVRVAASDVCHVFEPKRPGQIRGVPIVAPILTKLRNIGDYEDAVLERQKIANLFVAFITRALPTLNANDPTMGALGAQLAQVWSAGEVPGEGAVPSDALAPMAPGLLQELEDGQSVTFANPPEAGTTYSDYMRTSHLGSAAASGIPYELYSGDILNISDRTLRVLINEFRRLAQQRQWQILIPQACQKIVEWFADAAALAGLITVDEVPLVKRCTHSPHGWAYIHPVQDVQGKALEVLNGFRSRSDVVGERGDDIEAVDLERQADQEREVELGLRPDPTAMPDPNGGESQQQSGGQQQDDQTKKAMRQLAAAHHELQALVEARAPTGVQAAARQRVQELLLAIETDE